MNRRGFTLIELVMVIVIIGILAAIAIPRFVDLTGQADQAATRGGLGAIRAAAAIKFANQVATSGGTNQSWPLLSGTDFAGGLIPTNQLNNQSAITHTNVTMGNTTSASGWWYVTGDQDDNAAAGRAGAYTNDTAVTDPTGW